MSCPGCFAEKSDTPICPQCGYDESLRRSPLVLPHHTRLYHDRYRVGRLLGKPGGFGLTYLGWDERLQTKVALKEYLPRDLAGRESDRQTVAAHSHEDGNNFAYGLGKFLEEARTLAQLDHPNLVRVRDFFEEHSTAYLVMDYYDGLTLAEYLTRQPGGKIPEEQAIGILLPILDGLREVHAKGFLHRDIKPQNIYLTAGNRPILLDFGAARQAMGEHSRSLSVVLSEGYAPIEQYQRNGQQGPWTDLYGAAATLYTMVTGQVPPSATDRLGDQGLLPGLERLSPKVALAIRQGMANEPAQRPRSIEPWQCLLLDEPPDTGHPQGDAPQASAPNGEALEGMVVCKQCGKVNLAMNRYCFACGQSMSAWASVMPELDISSINNRFKIVAIGVLVAFAVWLYKAGNMDNYSPAQPNIAAPSSPSEAYHTETASNTKDSTTTNTPVKEQVVRPEQGQAGDIAELMTQANNGNATAQYALGEKYEEGFGVARNVEQALFWYEKSAAANYGKAQNRLGYLYFTGRDVSKDPSQAFYWFTKAAEQGLSNAQYNLGYMYLEGIGIPKNVQLGKYWMQRAAQQEDEDAKKWLATLENQTANVTETQPQENASNAASGAPPPVAASNDNPEVDKARRLAQEASRKAQAAARQAQTSAGKGRTAAAQAQTASAQAQTAASEAKAASERARAAQAAAREAGEWDGSSHYGVWNSPKGERYEGEWKKNNFNGHGVYSWPNGGRYEGEWNGNRSGHGIDIVADGRRYEGEWKKDKPNGYGVRTWPDGQRYEGGQLNGESSDHGILAKADGQRYEGEWKMDKVNGYGVFTWPDGQRYEGGFLNSESSGHGIFTPADGERYEGEWKKHKFNGHGVYTRPDGERSESGFLNGELSGHGIQIYPNGQRYEGAWKKNKREGQGALLGADGRVLQAGRWHDDAFVE